MIEDFINAMSVLYHKGHFILGAEMEDNFNFALYPDVGTEMGMCKTIKPMVRKTEILLNCIKGGRQGEHRRNGYILGWPLLTLYLGPV